MLEKILRSLDVGTEEAQIYLELLATGPSTAGTLAKRLATIPRATLYDLLKKLTGKGLVLRSLKGGVRTFRAEAPENLNRLFEKRIEDLQVQQVALNQLLPALNKGGASLSPRFEFFEGLASVKYAMQDFLFHHDVESLNYWHVSMIELLGREHFFYSNKKRLENNIRQKLIVVGAKDFSVRAFPFLGEGALFKRALRVAPATMTMPMSYWIYKSKVLFLSSRLEAYAYIVESHEMAGLMREQFAAVWQQSTPYRMKAGEADEFLQYLKGRTPSR